MKRYRIRLLNGDILVKTNNYKIVEKVLERLKNVKIEMNEI